jgi:hypothetical protein
MLWQHELWTLVKAARQLVRCQTSQQSIGFRVYSTCMFLVIFNIQFLFAYSLKILAVQYSSNDQVSYFTSFISWSSCFSSGVTRMSCCISMPQPELFIEWWHVYSVVLIALRTPPIFSGSLNRKPLQVLVNISEVQTRRTNSNNLLPF